MPNGIDPKAYAARLTNAKKILAKTDPATRAKIKDMYPPVKKEAIVKKALDPKKPAAKKPAVKRPGAKPAPLPAKPKPKPKVVQMPTKISPSKMTPAQKARYLKNPERFDG